MVNILRRYWRQLSQKSSKHEMLHMLYMKYYGGGSSAADEKNTFKSNSGIYRIFYRRLQHHSAGYYLPGNDGRRRKIGFGCC